MQAQQNSPPADRQVVAQLIRGALIPEAAKAKIEGEAKERHREVITNPIKDIVTYWRSEVSATAKFAEPDKRLTVEVPTLVRKKDEATVGVKIQAPIEGDVGGKALTDDGKKLIEVASPFKCTITATGDCTITRVNKDGAVSYKIEVAGWKPVITNLEFTGVLNRVKGPVEALANEKLKGESTKLRDAMNAALRKAYEEGRLSLPE